MPFLSAELTRTQSSMLIIIVTVRGSARGPLENDSNGAGHFTLIPRNLGEIARDYHQALECRTPPMQHPCYDVEASACGRYVNNVVRHWHGKAETPECPWGADERSE
jgi:hypothetical protein